MKNIQLSSINNGGAEIAASIINECIQEKNIFDSKIILDVDSEIKRKLFWFSFFQKSNTKKIKRYLRRNLNKLQSSPNPIKHSLSILQSFFDQYFNNSENNILIQNENCFLFDKFNYKDMGRADTNILNNQNLTKKFSLKSRNIPINKYSYKKITNKYIHLFKTTLSN